MGKLQEKIAITDNVVKLEFSLANVAANQDGTAVPRNANGNVYVMPWAGRIFAVAAELNAAVTQGTLTVIPTVSTVEKTPTVQLSTSHTQNWYGVQDSSVVRFAAGATIGMNYDSTANLLPDGTADLNAEIYVVFDDMKF